MRLSENLWIEGAYYVDFDELGQLRIVGPYNHLHFGSVGIFRPDIAIDSVYTEDGDLVINGRFLHDELFFHDPAMGHIQMVRHYIELPNKPMPPYSEVVKKHPAELAPTYIGVEVHRDGYEVSYRRLYGPHWYGTRWKFSQQVEVTRVDRRRGYRLKARDGGSEINFRLLAATDRKHVSPLGTVLLPQVTDTSVFSDKRKDVDKLLDRTAIEINHLIKNNKTSGFDYGTVFPRDWMESADLGQEDFQPDVLRYMYHKSYEHIDPEGSGWHEDVVGEFAYEREVQKVEMEEELDNLIDRSRRIRSALHDMILQVADMYIIRNMLDIEPRYLIGLKELSTKGFAPSDLSRLKRVAHYLILQAEDHDLITFKKLPELLRRHKHDEYFQVGNWRDSARAFRGVGPDIAPYDVNVVFYPLALEIIRLHADVLDADARQVDALIQKWQRVKDWYRFKNADGSTAFALALYDIKKQQGEVSYRQLRVNHVDEAYALFYGLPEEADLVSFCRRLLSQDYFFTPSGPTIVGQKDGYVTTEYHGQVIWTKQTAFTVAGLARQLEIAAHRHFRSETVKLLEDALVETARSAIDAFLKLGGVPELHYDDGGTPHFYNDQPRREGTMNQVQLWSAVGARRIISVYVNERKKHGKQLPHAGRRRTSKT